MSKMPFWKQFASQAILVVVGLFVLLTVYGLLNVSLDGSLQGAPVELHLVPEEF